MSGRIEYEVVDMFADGPLTGCALGVVPDAAGLSDEEMAAVAREIGASETAFVLPATTPGVTHRVRVFTPGGESPFGGHSAVGTAAALVRLGRLAAGQLVQQCGERRQPVEADPDGATLTATGPLEVVPFDPVGPAEACGLRPEDVDGTAATAGFGPAFHLLPVRPQALARAALRPEHPVWRGQPDVLLFAWDAATRTARARMFAPGYGMPEDPACASAALALGPWLVRAGLLPATTGSHPYRLRQGVELRRPAILACHVDVVDSRVTGASVSGAVLPGASGRMTLPAPTPAPTTATAPAQPEPTPEERPC
ncbi:MULTISPECIES: PhzF family phenazine biosynthesis protein [Actinosynnema]|uniref:PhzF family phenazine biosynthesis protein n=1 Tax=Actinosynnema TaxID=40566 RepID=UPI0020A5F82E|nr:PhzF family phenazine biosynthesis protein [Actinosynnema pretiosum]MCP2097775.1 trans-2,3-dihydro-3-hydroxyanthranilate isomerase [Actinosynnema pretiosum]